MDILTKKKRGRKPKNVYISEQVPEMVTEKKKRGRKKKYEIENFEKNLNREQLNNFNHNIIYSDDDEKCEIIPDKQIKKISFGNLDITVSKKVDPVQIEEYRSNMKTTGKESCIDENEYSDEETEIPIENVLSLNQENFEKYYKDRKKYISEFNTTSVDKSLKRLRVVTTLKNVITEDEWPEKTDTCCWWCCHKFTTSPCTLPIKYDSLRKRYTFVGIFCSWNCTKAYNFDKNDQRKYERAGLITLLIKELYNIEECIIIKSAPYRQTLKMFGGYMSIDEFRNNSSVVDSYHMNLRNYNYIYPEITEVTNVNVKSEKKNLRLSRV